MDFFTRRNVAILGLLQIGVLSVGVLSAGVCHKWYPLAGLSVPDRTSFWSEYGILTLVFPVCWVAVAMTCVGSDAESADSRGRWAIFSGLGMLAVWIGVVAYAAILPLFWIMTGGCPGGLSP